MYSGLRVNPESGATTTTLLLKSSNASFLVSRYCMFTRYNPVAPLPPPPPPPPPPAPMLPLGLGLGVRIRVEPCTRERPGDHGAAVQAIVRLLPSVPVLYVLLARRAWAPLDEYQR